MNVSLLYKCYYYNKLLLSLYRTQITYLSDLLLFFVIDLCDILVKIIDLSFHINKRYFVGTYFSKPVEVVDDIE